MKPVRGFGLDGALFFRLIGPSQHVDHMFAALVHECGNAVAAEHVQWLSGDITRAELAPRAYDAWHDRAVFHFLTTNEQRIAYVRQVVEAVKPGGHVLISTFGSEGPTKCSGLDVVRYDAESLHAEFGARFQMLDSVSELHTTPFGTSQQFLYCLCRLND